MSCFVFLYNAVLPLLPSELGGCRLDRGLGLRPRETADDDRGDSVRGEAGSSSARACAATDTSSASEPDSSEPDSSELDDKDEDAPSRRGGKARSCWSWVG